ncbi:hypothetical protein FB451DRAFT_1175902 [Mycena latifolia]|nr:hypothetical protein FB451DRAFT_1175902 [Mycena latifolia]
MTNPIDHSPIEPGPIALPLDPSGPQPTDRAWLHRFRRRALDVLGICFILAVVAFSVDELVHRRSTADDPRLELYQTPENANHCAEWASMATQVSETERHLASASFELPTAADLLFFLSRGPVSGHQTIVKPVVRRLSKLTSRRNTTTPTTSSAPNYVVWDATTNTGSSFGFISHI